MAEFHVLCAGYLSSDVEGRVASTVSLAVDGDVVAVIDPGLQSSRAAILDPLTSHGFGPDDVTDVVVSHHHPDHTLNVALFPEARLHDHWAWYRNDIWNSRPAEGFSLSAGIRLIETPGHTPQDISTLVDTDDGLVVATHLWWNSTFPEEDPYATDPEALHRNRERVLGLRGLVTVVPGHGPQFVPGVTTPR
jgi:glyoxylase-like metal-dependent hydrolase (beta-lactamase superfamily II)